MTEAEARRAIHAALTGEGFSRSPSRGSGPLRYEGLLRPGGRQVDVAVEFPCLFFTVFPDVILLDRTGQLPGVAAHIQGDDKICYAAPGLIVPDMYDPTGTALLVLALAERTLLACLTGEADADVRAEFPQHWRGFPFMTALGAEASSGPAQLVSILSDGEIQVRVLARDNTGLEWFSGVPGNGRHQCSEPAFLLNAGAELDLPGGMQPPEDLAELLVWSARLRPGLDAKVAGAVRHKTFRRGRTNLFFIAANGCVGVSLESAPVLAKRGFRPGFMADWMLSHPQTFQVSRLSGQPISRDFIFSRNLGGRPSLAGRRIVLVGCGTIGSHLARLLVQGGAGSRRPGYLKLVDKEVLSSGNIGRHLLPPRCIGASKAGALAEELTRQFPGSVIRALEDDVMTEGAKLDAAELVIDATGEEALSIALNAKLTALRPSAPDTIYVRLFGNGAAVQALFVEGKAAGGACFKCLRPSLGLAARFDPMNPGTELAFVPAGCGEGAFQPFGVGAPVIAAGLASRICMEWAGGNVGSTLRTLRVDGEMTRDVPDCSPGMSPHCPACGPHPAAGP